MQCGGVVDRTKPVWNADTAVRSAINFSTYSDLKLPYFIYSLLIVRKRDTHLDLQKSVLSHYLNVDCQQCHALSSDC